MTDTDIINWNNRLKMQPKYNCERIKKNYMCSNVFRAFFIIKDFVKTGNLIISSGLFLFEQARLQRGNVLLKQGRLDEAHIDYEAVVRLDFVVHEINNKKKN